MAQSTLIWQYLRTANGYGVEFIVDFATNSRDNALYCLQKVFGLTTRARDTMNREHEVHGWMGSRWLHEDHQWVRVVFLDICMLPLQPISIRNTDVRKHTQPVSQYLYFLVFLHPCSQSEKREQTFRISAHWTNCSIYWFQVVFTAFKGFKILYRHLLWVLSCSTPFQALIYWNCTRSTEISKNLLIWKYTFDIWYMTFDF